MRLFVKNYKNTTDGNVRTAVGRLSGVVCMVINIVLALAKITIGVLFGVLSALADGINNLSDCGNNVISIIGFKLSSKPADKDHPYGHRRIEYVASLAVGIVIAVLALQLFAEGVGKIITPVASDFSWWTVGVLGASVLGKLWMFIFNRKLAKRYSSDLLQATATDSISDVLATSGVLLAVFLTKWTGFLYFDGITTIIVAVLIALAGLGILKNTMNQLLGTAPDKNLTETIYNRIMQYDGVLGIHDLTVHNYGPEKYYASVHVEVDSSVDVMESHEMIDTIERDFAEHTNITLVVHMDPIVIGDPELDGYKDEIRCIVGDLDNTFNVHDFRMVKGPERTNLIFDIAIPYESEMTANEIFEHIQRKVSELHSNVYIVPTIEKQSCEGMEMHKHN